MDRGVALASERVAVTGSQHSQGFRVRSMTALVRAAAGLSLLATLGCLSPPVQTVRLHLEPARLAVFVDGQEQPGTPSELVLRSDLDHLLFFRREGYQPERVVLRTLGEGLERRLAPAEVRVRLRAIIPTTQDIRIESDESPESG